MDGTLLDSEKRISQGTKKILRDAQKKGTKIIITTGRIFVSAEFYSNYIGLETPIIACNGAIIKEVGNQEIFTTFPLHKQTLMKAAQICEEIDTSYHFYSEDKIYSLRSMDWFNNTFLKEKDIDPSFHIPISYIQDLSSILDIEEDILKLTIWDRDEKKVLKALEKIHQLEGAFVTSSNPMNIELTNKKATKGNAVEFLARHYKIDQSEIIAIGDSSNDRTMIEYAGLGVAMENARRDIKEIADYVTLSNDNEGVAEVFKKFIL